MLMTRGEATVRSLLGIAGWLLGSGRPGADPHSSMSRICLCYGISRSEIVLVIHRNYRTHQHSILSSTINFMRWSAPFRWQRETPYSALKINVTAHVNIRG
jgi:hypothetical protein